MYEQSLSLVWQGPVGAKGRLEMLSMLLGQNSDLIYNDIATKASNILSVLALGILACIIPKEKLKKKVYTIKKYIWVC